MKKVLDEKIRKTFTSAKFLNLFLITFILLLLIIPFAGNESKASGQSISRISHINSKTFQVYGPKDIHKIKHVVVVIVENQAFDTIFGTYPYGFRKIVKNVTHLVTKQMGRYLTVSFFD